MRLFQICAVTEYTKISCKFRNDMLNEFIWKTFVKMNCWDLCFLSYPTNETLFQEKWNALWVFYEICSFWKSGWKALILYCVWCIYFQIHWDTWIELNRDYFRLVNSETSEFQAFKTLWPHLLIFFHNYWKVCTVNIQGKCIIFIFVDFIGSMIYLISIDVICLDIDVLCHWIEDIDFAIISLPIESYSIQIWYNRGCLDILDVWEYSWVDIVYVEFAVTARTFSIGAPLSWDHRTQHLTWAKESVDIAGGFSSLGYPLTRWFTWSWDLLITLHIISFIALHFILWILYTSDHSLHYISY